MIKSNVRSYANEDVRKAARIANIPLWRIASELGVSEPTFTRWLRVPLSAGRKTKIRAAIKELSGGKEAS